MVNGHDDKSIPWQVRAITFFGVPSAIAIFLVYVLADSVTTKLERHSEILNQQNSRNGDVIKMIENENKIQQTNMELVIRILRANCVNNSVTNVERDRCNGWDF